MNEFEKEIKRIKDCTDEINKAFWYGIPEEEVKKLHIKKNSLFISPDTKICRIFNIDYFLEDVTNSTITLARLDPNNYGHNENYFIDKEFKGEFTEGEKLDAILETYYGQPWSYGNPNLNWNHYLYNGFGIRVQATINNIMDTIMSIEDPFYSLNYFFSKVHYESEHYLETFRKNVPFYNLLDSQGIYIAILVSIIANLNYSFEQEVRLLYCYRPEQKNTFMSKVQWFMLEDEYGNINDFCKLPFDWLGVIEELILDYNMNDNDYNKYINLLINCGVSSHIIQKANK